MAHFIVGRDELLLPWAAGRIAHIQTPDAFGEAVSMGVMTGDQPDDRLLAVVVFHMFTPAYQSCMISVAATSPRWCSRATVRGILSVPFYQYGCNRVWTATPHTSERVIRLNKKLGFKQEGVLREGFGPKVHAVCCGMLRREFERRYMHGQKKSLAAGTA